MARAAAGAWEESKAAAVAAVAAAVAVAAVATREAVAIQGKVVEALTRGSAAQAVVGEEAGDHRSTSCRPGVEATHSKEE